MTPDRLLTLDEVAELTRLPKTELYRLIANGDLAPHWQDDELMVSRHELEEWVEEETD